MLYEVITIQALPQVINALINFFIRNIDKIILTGVKLFVALIENLPLIIVEIVRAIPQIISGIVTAIGSLTYKLAEAGGNLIRGLWEGISDMSAWLWDKISGFFGGIVDGIKEFFGINSPSTLFAGLGRNMGEGIGIGFENAMAQVSRDMKNSIPTSFEVGADIRGKYSGNSLNEPYLTNTNITQNISITSQKALSEKEAAREFRNLSRKLALEL